MNVRMLFFGTMTIDASHSDFAIAELTMVNVDTDLITMECSVLTVHQHKGGMDYALTLSASPGTLGRYDVRILCESNNPAIASANPTLEPTPPTATPSHRSTGARPELQHNTDVVSELEPVHAEPGTESK